MNVYEEARGNSPKVGNKLSKVPPVVRINPARRWKSIFAVGTFPKHTNGLNDEDSTDLLQRFGDVLVQNRDPRVRFKQRNPNDIG